MLLGSAGFGCASYPSAEAFIAVWKPETAGCVLLDVVMPGLGGIELLHWLQRKGSVVAVVMLTGHGDLQLAVRAIKAGANEFIEKPCNAGTVIRLVREAVAASNIKVEAAAARDRMLQSYLKLSPREREVMTLVCQGLANKNIGPVLGIAHRTVEVHRARVMSKMSAESLADLIKMQLQLEEQFTPGTPRV